MYLKFEEQEDGTIDFINDENIKIGYFEKIRVGAWMSWVYFLHKDCYLSGSCSDEVRSKQKELNYKRR